MTLLAAAHYCSACDCDRVVGAVRAKTVACSSTTDLLSPCRRSARRSISRSPETIYKAFGSKATLLGAVVTAAIRGDTEATPLRQRPVMDRGTARSALEPAWTI